MSTLHNRDVEVFNREADVLTRQLLQGAGGDPDLAVDVAINGVMTSRRRTRAPKRGRSELTPSPSKGTSHCLQIVA